jgi:hypothetical protein
MKVYMVADKELPGEFRLCIKKQNALNYLAGKLKHVWTRLSESQIRALGCSKKLPKGEQIITVRLEMR